MDNPDDKYITTAFDKIIVQKDAGFGSNHLGSSVKPYGGPVNVSDRFKFGCCGAWKYIKVFRPDSTVRAEDRRDFFEKYLVISSLCTDESVFTGWFISAAAYMFPLISTYIWTNIESLSKRNVVIINTSAEDLFNRISLEYLVQDYQGKEIFSNSKETLQEGVIYKVFCICVLVMGKTPGKYWNMFVKQRAEAFASVEFNTISSEIQGYSPRQNVALFLHKFLGPMYSLKDELIRSLEIQSTSSKLGSECFRSTLVLLRYYGMTEFFYIHHYLFCESHPCLYVPTLRREIELYSEAVNQFLKIPVEERPFIKITKELQDSHFIHWERFPKLSAAAIHVAICRGKTNMRNYVSYKTTFDSTHNRALLAFIDSIEQVRGTFMCLPREKVQV